MAFGQALGNEGTDYKLFVKLRPASVGIRSLKVLKECNFVFA